MSEHLVAKGQIIVLCNGKEIPIEVVFRTYHDEVTVTKFGTILMRIMSLIYREMGADIVLEQPQIEK